MNRMELKSNLKWDPYLPGYFTDPYPFFKIWRTENPIQKVFDNTYFFFRFWDIDSIIKNKELKVLSLSDYLGEKEDYIFKKSKGACPYLSKGTELWPMYLNGDLHKQIRVATTKAIHRLTLDLDGVMLEAIDKTHALYRDKDYWQGRKIYLLQNRHIRR